MSGWISVLGFVLALDGLRISTLTPTVSGRDRLVGVGVAAAVAVVVALLAEPVFEAGDVSPETFRIAAGLIVAAVAVRRLILGGGQPYTEVPTRWSGLVPAGFPVALSPELVAWAASRGVDDLGAALAGIAVAAVVAAVTSQVSIEGVNARLGDAWIRLSGAGLGAVAVVLLVDGIRSV
ncbi:MAG: hypothetical protein AAFZ07_06845 [Actinomycetota bacterium]